MTFAAQVPLGGFLLWANRCTVHFANEKPQVWLKLESLKVGHHTGCKQSNGAPTYGIGTATEGSCKAVSRWNLGLHIGINILSSAMLGASNYTMQCVTAPTREECDSAHARNRWLDIGVPSIRNLAHISRHRKILWALLALSSTPIHLLYNSSVFKTLDTNAYTAVHVSDQFLQRDFNLSAAFQSLSNISTRDPYAYGQAKIREQNDVRQHSYEKIYRDYVEHTSSYEPMSPEDCIATYTTPFVTGHSNVIMITNYTTDDTRANVNTVLHSQTDVLSFTSLEIPYVW
jgi:hypothetical protein